MWTVDFSTRTRWAHLVNASGDKPACTRVGSFARASNEDVPASDDVAVDQDAARRVEDGPRALPPSSLLVTVMATALGQTAPAVADQVGTQASACSTSTRSRWRWQASVPPETGRRWRASLRTCRRLPKTAAMAPCSANLRGLAG